MSYLCALNHVLNVRMKKLALFPLPGHNEYTLANGLRIIHQPAYSNVAYCGFAVDAGTRDELENEQGMAHFVEHLIFKGTQKRKAWHILNRMENVGGDLNGLHPIKKRRLSILLSLLSTSAGPLNCWRILYFIPPFRNVRLKRKRR